MFKVRAVSNYERTLRERIAERARRFIRRNASERAYTRAVNARARVYSKDACASAVADLQLYGRVYESVLAKNINRCKNGESVFLSLNIDTTIGCDRINRTSTPSNHTVCGSTGFLCATSNIALESLRFLGFNHSQK